MPGGPGRISPKATGPLPYGIGVIKLVNLNSELPRSTGRRECLNVSRLEGHCGCGWPRVKAISEQWILLVGKGQWHA